MLDELMMESYGNMERRLKTGMNGGVGCHGPADRQNTEEEEDIRRRDGQEVEFLTRKDCRFEPAGGQSRNSL